MAYRYYSTLRPLMVGGIPFPKQPGESITTIVNFEEGRTYCKDIDRPAWEDAEAAIRELHARGPEIERLYLDSKILPGELRALVMVSNCLEREFIHRQLATGQPLHMNVL